MKVSSVTVRRAVGALVILGAVLVPLVVLQGGGNSPAKRPAKLAPGSLYAPGGQENEGASRLSLEEYWGSRLTYPTGRFDSRWLLKAAKQARLVKRSVPASVRSARSADTTKATAGLNPSAFVSLGPQPQESINGLCNPLCFNFGRVGGRVNAIAIDPVDPTVAYFGADGGGIWKTTNCCSPATLWTVTTDGPNIPTTTIDDLFVDPSNRWVYAATGDVSFGSTAFGSAGILRSRDQGATWEVLGQNVFGPALPVAPNTYPQYQAVTRVETDPNNRDTIIAPTKDGLFFSYDSGANWTGPCYTNGFSTQRQDVTDMAVVDIGASTELYAAVGTRGYPTTVQPNLGKNGANGVYKTTVPAGGCPASWDALTNGWPAGTASGTPCDPAVGSQGQCPAGTNELGRIELAVAPSTVADNNPQVHRLYAVVQAVDTHGTGQPPPNNQVCGVLIRSGLVTNNPTRGCFLGVWRTDNSGSSWTQTATHTDLFNLTTAGPCGEDTPQNWYNEALAVDPTNPDALFMDAIDIWKSTNAGDTFFDISCGYDTSLVNNPVHVDNHELVFAPPVNTPNGPVANTLLAGNDGGIYVTNDASAPPATGVPAFTQINNSVGTIEFYSGDISSNFGTTASTPPTIVGGAQDNGSSSFAWANAASIGCAPPPATDCNWQQRIGGDGMFARMEAKVGQRVYLESQNGAIRTSQTGHEGPYSGSCGLTTCQPNWPWRSDQKSFIFPYELDKFDCVTNNTNPTCDHIIAGSYGVWESVEFGGVNPGTNLPADTMWDAVSPDLTKCNRPLLSPRIQANPCLTGLMDRAFINQLTYAPSDNRVALVGTNDGNVQYGFNLGTNTPWAPGCAGTTCALWINVTDGNTLLPNRPILDVAIAPNDKLVGYAAVGGFNENTPGTPGHVFQVTCTANCASFTWADKTGNLPNIPVDSIAVNPHIPQQVFAGTDWGLYYTNNINAASPTWFSFRNGLPATMIWDMAIDRGATTLAVFTRGRGAFAWPLPTALPPGNPIFSDDMNDLHGWTVSHELIGPANPTLCSTNEWHLTMADTHSPQQAWTNNPYREAGTADPNSEDESRCNNYLTSPSISIPAGAGSVKFRFWEHHFTEGPNTATNPCNPPDGDPPCDFGVVEVSTDNGGTWTTVSSRYEGGTAADPYTQSEVNLGSVAGQTIRIRFAFSSDFSVASPPFTGWSVDDVEIRAEVPTLVKTASFTAKANARNRGVTLTWRTASELDTVGFNVLRVAPSGKSARVNRTPIRARNSGGLRGITYRLVDKQARPRVAYTYRLQTVHRDGTRTWSATARVRVAQ